MRCGPRLFRDVEERNEKAVAGKVIWKSTGWEKKFRGENFKFFKARAYGILYCTMRKNSKRHAQKDAVRGQRSSARGRQNARAKKK